MFLFMVLLCVSRFFVEGKVDTSGEISAASPAQIRFAIENRYDDTGPGANGQEKAHKMYVNLDEALAAFLSDPDTKLSDSDKIRAFHALVRNDYGHPNQQITDGENGAYKLVSFNPNKIKYEQPPYPQPERPQSNHAWLTRGEPKWRDEPPHFKGARVNQHFQESPNQYKQRENNYGQVQVPFRDHGSKHNIEAYREVYSKHAVDHEQLLDEAFNPASLQHQVAGRHTVFPQPQPSASRVVFRPDNQPSFTRFPSTKQPSFFDLQKIIVKADKQNLLPESHGQDAGIRNRQYHYSYGVKEPKTGDWKSARVTHHQNGDISGYYSLMDADGKTRVVQYTADNDGFKATVDRSKNHHYLIN